MTVKPRAARPRVATRVALAVAASTSIVVSACGTRLPDEAFSVGSPPPLADAVGQGAQGGASDGETPVTVGVGGRITAASAGPRSTGSARGGRTAAKPATGSEVNPASDVGVTATTVVVGNIVSQTNAFDPRAFVGPYYGVRAYFDWLNAHGGVHGRRVVLARCDDQGTGTRDTQCVQRLVDDTKVFAFAGNAILAYAGAAYVNSKGVPDVGGQPVDTAYYKFPHLWELYAEDYPRNGREVGFGGTLYNGTEVYRYFKIRFPSVPRKAGVVYYNQSQSQRYAQALQRGLTTEGYDVTMREVNFALPDFDSTVLSMKQAGVRYVFDALDRGGNERLCKSMDDQGLDVTAKVTTTQSWEASVGQDYDSSPRCRNALWAWSKSRSYQDTKYAPVAEFRAQMAREHLDGPDTLSEWALEGWAAAQWLTDAMASCGATLTRRCVEAYLAGPADYDGHGLLTPRRYAHPSSPPRTVTNCLNVARWQDSARGWVTQVADMDRNCFTTPNVAYSG